MYLPACPTIAAELSCPVGTVQLTLAVFLLGLAAGQVLWGSLADRIGRRIPLLAGCLLFTLTSILCALTDSIELLLVARFVMGVAGSAGSVVPRAIVRDLFEEAEAARFYALTMLIGGLAPVVAPVLGGLLFEAAGWRPIFWSIAAIGAASFALTAALVPETLPPAARAAPRPGGLLRTYAWVLSRRAFLAPALALGCSFGMLFSYITSSSLVFITVYGVAPGRFGLLFGAVSLVLYLGALASRWLLLHRDPAALLRLASLVAVAGGVGLVACAGTGWGGFPLFFALLLVSLSNLGLLFPIVTAMTMQPFPAMAGAASALLGILQFLIGALAGALSGLIHDGTAVPMAVQIALFALATWLLLGLAPSRR
jgi:DHA1 family bicyclomycin/chloramphenicol resistance-like MFS transporter